ncbi:MAG: hypothetical protein K8R90_10675 [Candidatus Cloacimonetes bacterium]|nr:hypothetical protein [Candidatus Cloacimonadota bacterium]
MKHAILAIIMLSVFATALAQIQKPSVHSTIMLDAKFYSGDTANDGSYDRDNRFQVRKAALAFEGVLTDRVDYALEVGTSTCVGIGGGVKLMEAVVMYALADNFHIGLQQGHILRGMAATTECAARLTMEKPAFLKTFGSCHPLGFVANNYIELGERMGLEAELAILNGVNGTLQGEHDYNLGIIFDTPVEGLSVAGVYNHTAQSYFDDNYEEYSEDGYRAGGGLNYLAHGIWVTGEYFTGKGFESDDQEMNAWYAQGGYEFSTGLERLPAVQPYICYESWDRDSENDSDAQFSYIEAGLNLRLSANTIIKSAYRTPHDTPDSAVEEPASFIVRLQTGF